MIIGGKNGNGKLPTRGHRGRDEKEQERHKYPPDTMSPVGGISPLQLMLNPQFKQAFLLHPFSLSSMHSFASLAVHLSSLLIQLYLSPPLLLLFPVFLNVYSLTLFYFQFIQFPLFLFLLFSHLLCSFSISHPTSHFPLSLSLPLSLLSFNSPLLSITHGIWSWKQR